MTSLIAGTWSLISSSAEVIRSARGMTNRIQRLLQLQSNDLNEGDRRRLLSLQKRVECLVQPLNFLLLWSKKRDSCVQQAVLNAQELLFDVCSYVERFVPADGVLSTTAGKGGQASRRGSLEPEQLEYYLRELEFACASVSMALSISRVIDAPVPPPNEELVQAPSRRDDSVVSLAALLKASRRIQDMKGHTGDLCACPGRLYSQAVSSRSVPSVAPAVDAVSPAVDADRCDEDWSCTFSQATFKVVAYDDLRRPPGKRRYRISIDSSLPLRPRDGSRVALSREVGDDESRRGLNDVGPLVFPMKVALDASLMTTANMVLPAENKCLRDLGIDSIVLVWGAASSSSDAPIEASAEFPDAVFLPDTADPDIEGLPRSLQFATLSRREFSRTSLGRSSSSLPGRYAFVFDGPRGTAEARAGEAEVALTPLDALYLARLCALDGDPATASVVDGNSDGSVGACPPHLLSSDEVLRELLQEPQVSGRGITAKATSSIAENGYSHAGDISQVRDPAIVAEA